MTHGTYGEGYLIPTIVDSNSTLGDASTTINGGNFSFGRNGFRNFANSNTYKATLTVNGGTFTGTSASQTAFFWNQKPNANIANGQGVMIFNGGTYTNWRIQNGFYDLSTDPTTFYGVTIAEGLNLTQIDDR